MLNNYLLLSVAFVECFRGRSAPVSALGLRQSIITAAVFLGRMSRIRQQLSSEAADMARIMAGGEPQGQGSNKISQTMVLTQHCNTFMQVTTRY